VFARVILYHHLFYQGSRTVSNFHLQQSSNKGINVGGIEIKLLNFADDMTTFVRDKKSYLTLFNVINLFGTHTGLKINHDKTECLLCGNLKENACSLELDVCGAITTNPGPDKCPVCNNTLARNHHASSCDTYNHT